MTKYIQIDTPFKRDIGGSNKMIEGQFRDETVEFLKDNEWVCTEKIDGTNIGVVWDGHAVKFQGRTEIDQIPTHLTNRLIELFGSTETEKVFEELFGETNIILFGECYGAEIQGGDKYSSDASFILFDVYLPAADLWLTRRSVERIARAFNIDVVPIIIIGTLQEAIDYIKTQPDSTIGTAKMEGLVCHPSTELRTRTGERVIVKIKVEDFV